MNILETPAVLEQLAQGCRIDDLQVNGLGIVQHPDGYCFTGDPVLLANFCPVHAASRVVDLGSGAGILGVLLVGKYGAKSYVGVELQERLVTMSRATFELNRLALKCRVEHVMVQTAHTVLAQGAFDLVVSNPPYTQVGNGSCNESEEIALARHETKLSLRELVEAAAKLVKFGGKFCMVHQAERLADVCAVLTEFDFAPKRIRLIEGRVGLAPTLFLVEAMKGGKVGVKIERNLTLYNLDGSETAELTKIYAREKA